jgi:phage gpG-like protein
MASVTMVNNLSKLLEKQTKQAKINISKEIALITVRHFQSGFRNGGGQTDAGKWAKRKNNKDPERAILVKTGSLRNSVKIYKITSDQVVISSNLNYSDNINFGTNNMEAREFLGKSTALDRKIETVIEKILKSNIK